MVAITTRSLAGFFAPTTIAGERSGAAAAALRTERRDGEGVCMIESGKAGGRVKAGVSIIA
jgi:hypothetical protein